jgi:ankyrin repeat protein
VNYVLSNCTPLLRAATKGHTEAASMLIAAGADVNYAKPVSSVDLAV